MVLTIRIAAVGPPFQIKLIMKDWLKLKRYTHFSPPLEKKHIPFIRSYVEDPAKIKSHRFYPFIHYSIQANRFRRAYNEHGVRHELRTLKEKKREIFYADHLDAQILAYYGFLIKETLEEVYTSDALLNESVIAYRSISFSENRSKCNIDFSKEVFDFILDSNSQELSVLCFDIKSFFDSLDHKILKKAWSGLLGRNNLPDDHYQVYKAITKFTYVEIGDLIEEFDELKIKKVQYLRRRGITSFCKSGREFRARVKDKGLIHFNRYDFEKGCVRDYGIPQGSPISAVISNLYMLKLDKVLAQKAKNIGGLYRRYSDDLLFICPPEDVDKIKAFVLNHVLEDLKLNIQEEKTQEVHFRRKSVSDIWSCTMIEDGVEKEKPLSYLGFEFDGKTIRVRQKSLSQYYRKIKRLIRRRATYANYAKEYNERGPAKEKDAWIYRQRIYQSKSHLGAKKKRVNGKVFWGNYISYIHTASRIMNEPALRKQIKNHWRIIEREISEWEDFHELEKTPSRRGEIM
jgi:hypothetical protein